MVLIALSINSIRIPVNLNFTYLRQWQLTIGPLAIPVPTSTYRPLVFYFSGKKLYARDGITRLKPQKKGRPRVTNLSPTPKPSEQMTEKELRDELEYLRAENAVLKKLEALAQARQKKAKTRR